jgi:hippurate hydrolase
MNGVDETDLAVSTARRLLGSDNVDANMQPVMGAEDFAFMLQAKAGCYVLLGADGGEPGLTPCQLHNPHYDFNDELIPLGMQYWVNLVGDFFKAQ